MKIRVTDEQMGRIRDHLYNNYPWLYRENTAYTAELISVWEVEFDQKFEKDIKKALAL